MTTVTRHADWKQSDPKRLAFLAHRYSLVTALLISRSPRLIISASDDHTVQSHSPYTGERIYKLAGHEGGVWDLGLCSRRRLGAPTTTDGARRHHMLVSGSTDRTLRIWDLETSKNTHVFAGHTSTIRCLAVARPTWIDAADGSDRREKWPKQTMIVSGSRDHTLMVWRLPRPGNPEYRDQWKATVEAPTHERIESNPYHLRVLRGHEDAVRAVAVHGRTIVSGSFDAAVRVWDLVTGEAKFVLKGHMFKGGSSQTGCSTCSPVMLTRLDDRPALPPLIQCTPS